ncbi:MULTISPECIES: hypothetical protein [unclassified Sphingomonas]|uniref:hypothetical protein n=1 Tax=unclassified Sphingomonas TaxID=196159 RepID=UPI00226A3C26|nr:MULTISPECIES: hypothetical protein [unclassified Sphingomonas]
MASFDSPLDMAKTQVALRALRYGHFPADIFDEYAWDMMLHMYIAALRNQTMYVDNIVNLTSKTKLVGDRWIAFLIKEGMATREEDAIALSHSSFERMDSYHRQALELLEP